MLAIYCIGARRLHGFFFPRVPWFPLSLLGVLSTAAGRFDGLGSKEEKGREPKHMLSTNIICLFKEGFAVSYSSLLNDYD